MWNSQFSPSEKGRRYKLEEISVLLLTLDELLDQIKSQPVADVVEETILRRLEKNELVYAIYQVFEALLGDVAIPEKGHTGIQEAIIAELLTQAYGRVCGEIELGEADDSLQRKHVWNSVDRLLIHRNPKAPELPWMLAEAGVKMSDPHPYLSHKLNLDLWETLICGEGGLFDEFLWDDDWRMDQLMDLPAPAADKVTQVLGLDLDVVQALPHTPSAAEYRMAEHYLYYLVWKDEVLHESPSGG